MNDDCAQESSRLVLSALKNRRSRTGVDPVNDCVTGRFVRFQRPSDDKNVSTSSAESLTECASPGTRFRRNSDVVWPLGIQTLIAGSWLTLSCQNSLWLIVRFTRPVLELILDAAMPTRGRWIRKGARGARAN